MICSTSDSKLNVAWEAPNSNDKLLLILNSGIPGSIRGTGPVQNLKAGGQFFWTLKDHLGNTRVVLNNSGNVVESHNYYPFGMRWDNASAPDYNYTYNGKEEQKGVGKGLLNYGARFYDPSIGRFTGVDPLADLAPDWTPYRYGFNNPLKYTDPTGMFEYSDGYSTSDGRNESGAVRHNGAFSENLGVSDCPDCVPNDAVQNGVQGAFDLIGKALKRVGDFFKEGNAEGNYNEGITMKTKDGLTMIANGDRNSIGSNPAVDGQSSKVIIETDDFLIPGNTFASKVASKNGGITNVGDKFSKALNHSVEVYNMVPKVGGKVITIGPDSIGPTGSTYIITKNGNNYRRKVIYNKGSSAETSDTPIK